MAVREFTIDDPQFTPKAQRNALERLALRFIRDERDLPFVWLSAQMTLVLIPLAVLLYWPGMFRWWMAPIYWAVLFGFFFDRYILMLHNTSHRPLFKREYGWLKFYIPWVLGPFCGETPETYYIHHITMHHAEGNLPRDLSSTMKYQRDSVLDFLRYFADFFFLSMYKLGAYQLGKKRPRLFFWMIVGEGSFLVLVAVGLWWNAPATLTVFVVPYLLCRFLMMCGNWAQHAFVDANDPGNSYLNSITCINTRYNRRCFNDGYHIGHHLVANRHWTEMPGEFLANRDKYAASGAIVFHGIDFFQVWFFLMTKNYDALARHFVDLAETPRSREEIIALLKSRVRAIDCTRPEILAAVPT
jgi:fatty acid desaturase